MGCGSSAKGKYDAPAGEAGAPGSTPPAAAAGSKGIETDKPAAAVTADAAPAQANGTPAATPAATTAPAAAATPAPAAAPTTTPEVAPASSPEVAKAEALAKEAQEADTDEEDEFLMNEEQELQFEAQVSRRTVNQEAKRGTVRMAVSSEVKKRDADWKAPVYEKTQEQEERLTKSLSASFMFSALSGDALPVVLQAFQEMKIASGTTVITEGEEVVSDKPALFVHETGKLSVYKKSQEGVVFQYNSPGQYFGELALLYNAPRAATVVADEDCTVWSLDRDTFTYLVKDAARMCAQLRIQFLEQVPILKGLDAEEKAKLSDVMNVQFFTKGEYIIKQGSVGETFYILESGKLEALKDGTKVLEYNAKDYFGELALLRHAPRAADVVALETSKVLSLDAASFKRVVGSLEEMMKERSAMYGEVTIPT